MPPLVRFACLESCSGEVTITCEAIEDEQVVLGVDADGLSRLLKLQVFDPLGRLICERVVRALPARIPFRPSLSGRYRVQVTTIGTAYDEAPLSLTWSDWDEAVSGRPRVRDVQPESASGAACLTVLTS